MIWREPAILVALVSLGAVLRAHAVGGASFPLNDGGLLLSMSRDLLEAGSVIPSTATYNGAGIPFAYPPLGIYMLAAGQSAGLPGTDLLRVVPAVISTLTIPIAWLVFRQLLPDQLARVVATGAFALSTGAYEWTIMGGGLTRSLGLLLSLSALASAIWAARLGRSASVVIAGGALGLTGLSHPQASVFAIVSVILCTVVVAKGWKAALSRLAGIGLVAAALVVPWVLVVLGEHGVSPFTSAIGSGGTLGAGTLNLLSSRTSGGALGIVGIATTFGMGICVARRYWLPVIWALVVVALDSRAGQPYLGVPAAVAIGVGAQDIWTVLVKNLRVSSVAKSQRTAVAALAFLAAVSFADSLASQSSPSSPLRSLPASTLSAMDWVAHETAETKTFAVVSGRYWALDAEAEWFPTLANRRSLTTVQGTEWLPAGSFDAAVERAESIARCAVAEDEACTAAWLDQYDPDYVFAVDTPPSELGGVACCEQLVALLERGELGFVVHRTATVTVLRLRD